MPAPFPHQFGDAAHASRGNAFVCAKCASTDTTLLGRSMDLSCVYVKCTNCGHATVITTGGAAIIEGSSPQRDA